ncbi:MAG: ribonuclease [Sphingomonadales bacterium BRH_c42]|nr:MAG: ribonuclease [Sphingomonadales bacterium BRH_c42]
MATRMLIDARHPEETRVAVLKGNRIEEFDFESDEHRQIKGNIYLAKVTRVEPSLQAAFVEFGGNRHGFLSFNEIHPDYYQIPREDREALLAEEAAAAEEEERLRAEDDDDYEDEDGARGDEYGTDDEPGADFSENGVEEIDTSEKDEVATIEDGHVDNGDYDDDGDGEYSADRPDLNSSESAEDDGDGDGDAGPDTGEESDRSRRDRGRKGRRRQGSGRNRAKKADEARERRMALRRRYKIQDVIQRRQVLLVQVVKEERGNKGAALTTYLSLAGRYTVLMPNSSHGGGISRKISSASDRKRLKQIVSDLVLPKSMGLIVRTAGLSRTKPEIKRDFDYLARLWDEIREKTLSSSAPKLIHSDSDLIKRAIRDIYNRDIEEVVVEGEDGYKSAREFMKLLMPSHARRVKAYTDPVPLFQRYGAEDQLRAMYDPVVQLKSGGYLVINPTEALVSIDINSGRSTKEHGIEQTALNTNLEATKEIARQLRLRDMAGLVVIDFIDMEYGSNVRKVEKAMKDALRNDRARIQVGRISGFGLMEMSRQRLRTGVLEATTRHCPHCDGTGLVRTASSAGLSALRLIEEEAARGKGSMIRLEASTEAAIYLLNAKRADLAEIEARYGVAVEVIPEGEDEGAKMAITSSGPRPTHVPAPRPIIDESVEMDDEDDFEDEVDFEDQPEEEERDGDPDKKRRRRRGGRGRNKSRQERLTSADEGDDEQADSAERNQVADDETGGDRPKKRRRRGGRRRRKDRGDGEVQAGTGEQTEAGDADTAEAGSPQDQAEDAADVPTGADEETPAPKRKRAPRKAKPAAIESEAPELAEKPADVEAEAPKRKRAPRKAKAAVDAEAASAAEPDTAPAEDAPAEDAPAEDVAPVTKAKPARKSAAAKPRKSASRAKNAATGSPEGDLAVGAGPASGSDAAKPENGEEGRRGWWQRTFGE